MEKLYVYAAFVLVLRSYIASGVNTTTVTRGSPDEFYLDLRVSGDKTNEPILFFIPETDLEMYYIIHQVFELQDGSSEGFIIIGSKRYENILSFNNTSAVILQNVANSRIVSIPMQEDQAETVYLFSKRRETWFVLQSTAMLIKKMEWKLLIIVYDNSTDVEVSVLIQILEKMQITFIKYNFDSMVLLSSVEEFLKTIYDQLHEVGLNIVTLCQQKCIETILTKADRFDTKSDNYHRTALYMKSQWLLVPVQSEIDLRNILPNLTLFNLAILETTGVLIEDQNISFKDIKSFLREEKRPFTISHEEKLSLVLAIDCTNKELSAHKLVYKNNIQTLLLEKNGRKLVPVSRDTRNSVFPNKNYGFNRRKFVVTTIVFYPFTMRVSNKTNAFYGYCIDLLDELANSLNFTYEISEVYDNEFGKLMHNGSWTGMVGLLQRREADMAAAALTVEARREMAMDFTYPFYFDAMTFLLRRPDPSKSKWLVFLRPFHWIVFVSVCATLPVGALILYCLRKYETLFTAVSARPYSYHYSLFYLFGALVKQGGSRPEFFRSSRLFVGAWWIFSVVLVETYCGNLVAFLTVTKEKSPINAFEELVSQSDYKWGTLGGSIYETLFENSSNPTFHKLWEGIQAQYPKDKNILHKEQEAHKKKVLEENYVYLFDKTYFLILTRNDCRYMIPEEEYPSIQYGFGLPNKSPYTRIFSEKISQFQESGLHNLWVNRHWPKVSYCKEFHRTEAERMTLIDMQSSFYLLAIGLVFSLLTLKIEYIVWCKKFRLRKSTNT